VKINQGEFQQLTVIINEMCGLNLGEEKVYLVEQRLGPLAKGMGCDSFTAFLARIRENTNGALKERLIEAITTNETSFFRDGHPYEALKKFILPRLAGHIQARKNKAVSRKGAKASVWCAASSTGQEPYSVAITMLEFIEENRQLGLNAEDFSVLATDISPKVLAKGIAGTYTGMEISRGLPPPLRDKYFKQTGPCWEAVPALQSMIDFRRINLTAPFTMLGGFDLILCRNVLIYFRDDLKKKIIGQFNRMLSDEGLLLLGACENMNGLSDEFTSLTHGQTIMYRPRRASPAAPGKERGMACTI